MKKLKILDVSSSDSLTKTGSFIGLKDLESLNFYGCSKLEELDSSVCCLDKLVRLNLKGCSGLKRFPWEMIGKLRSLQEIDLSGCVGIGFEDDEVIKAFMSSLKETHITTLTLKECNIYKVPSEVGSLTWLKHLDLGGNKFHSLPDSLGQLDQLETLCLSFCESLQSIPDLPRSVCSVKASDCYSLTSLPSNMSELTSLRKLDLDGCECLTSLPSGMSGTTSLEKLNLSGCSKLGIEDPAECLMKITGLTNLTVLWMGNFKVSQVPCEIGNLVSLEQLDLSGNTFSSLPDSFSNLLQLRDLSINDCSELTSLPLLPPLLKNIFATGCLSLDVMRSASAVVVDEFYRCPIPPLRNRADHYDLYEFSKCVLAAYKETSFHSRLQIDLSADEVPKWCHYIGTRQGESFIAPQLHSDMKIFGMILCHRTGHEFELQNKTKGTSFHLGMSILSTDCTMCVCFIALDNTAFIVEAGDEFAILDLFEEHDEEDDFEEHDEERFSEYGLCLIYKNKGDES